ncbi:MAG TPA: FMN-binding negative transcriptional regulator [Dehalococcoidia bacterium]
MYKSPRYPTTIEESEAFVAGQRHGYLIATPPGGHPSVSILPFVKSGDSIDLHCVQADPTFKALQANPRVTFFVSDFLAFSPHYWVDPVNAAAGTLHFRAVQYSCEATWSTQPADVAAALALILRTFEPEASYEPLADNEVYASRLRMLAAVRLKVTHTQGKFKVGPSAPNEVKQQVVRGLRERGEPNDARAADVIEATLRRV